MTGLDSFISQKKAVFSTGALHLIHRTLLSKFTYDKTKTKFLPKLDNIEIVWISNNPIYSLAELATIKTKYLVFDDTNYSSRIKLFGAISIN